MSAAKPRAQEVESEQLAAGATHGHEPVEKKPSAEHSATMYMQASEVVPSEDESAQDSFKGRGATSSAAAGRPVSVEAASAAKSHREEAELEQLSAGATNGDELVENERSAEHIVTMCLAANAVEVNSRAETILLEKLVAEAERSTVTDTVANMLTVQQLSTGSQGEATSVTERSVAESPALAEQIDAASEDVEDSALCSHVPVETATLGNRIADNPTATEEELTASSVAADPIGEDRLLSPSSAVHGDVVVEHAAGEKLTPVATSVSRLPANSCNVDDAFAEALGAEAVGCNHALVMEAARAETLSIERTSAGATNGHEPVERKPSAERIATMCVQANEVAPSEDESTEDSFKAHGATSCAAAARPAAVEAASAAKSHREGAELEQLAAGATKGGEPVEHERTAQHTATMCLAANAVEDDSRAETIVLETMVEVAEQSTVTDTAADTSTLQHLSTGSQGEATSVAERSIAESAALAEQIEAASEDVEDSALCSHVAVETATLGNRIADIPTATEQELTASGVAADHIGEDSLLSPSSAVQNDLVVVNPVAERVTPVTTSCSVGDVFAEVLGAKAAGCDREFTREAALVETPSIERTATGVERMGVDTASAWDKAEVSLAPQEFVEEVADISLEPPREQQLSGNWRAMADAVERCCNTAQQPSGSGHHRGMPDAVEMRPDNSDRQPPMAEAASMQAHSLGEVAPGSVLPVPCAEAVAGRVVGSVRHVFLQVTPSGAGLSLRPTQWGMLVEEIDPDPGQPGLRVFDTIVEINGRALGGPDTDATQDAFGLEFQHGALMHVVGGPEEDPESLGHTVSGGAWPEAAVVGPDEATARGSVTAGGDWPQSSEVEPRGPGPVSGTAPLMSIASACAGVGPAGGLGDLVAQLTQQLVNETLRRELEEHELNDRGNDERRLRDELETRRARRASVVAAGEEADAAAAEARRQHAELSVVHEETKLEVTRQEAELQELRQAVMARCGPAGRDWARDGPEKDALVETKLQIAEAHERLAHVRLQMRLNREGLQRQLEALRADNIKLRGGT